MFRAFLLLLSAVAITVPTLPSARAESANQFDVSDVSTPWPDMSSAPTCYPIHEVIVEGSDAAEFSWLPELTSRYLRKCIDQKMLNEISSEINSVLIDHGLVGSRVALPPQSLAFGVLRIALQGNHVSKVRMVDKDSGDADNGWGTHKNAFAGIEGGLLNVNDVEQGLDQMKRLSSQEVNVRLEPSAEPQDRDRLDGKIWSDVVIERKAATLLERVHGSVSIDNSGSHELGRTQMGSELSLDNPLGVNDIATVNLGTNAEHPEPGHENKVVGISYSAPLGYSLLTLSANQTGWSVNVPLLTTQALIQGRNHSEAAKLEHVLWRNDSSKLVARGALSVKSSRAFIEDFEFMVMRINQKSLELGAHFSSKSGNTSFDGDFALRRAFSGKYGYGGDVSESPWTLTPTTVLFGIDLAGCACQIEEKLAWLTSLRGQYSPGVKQSIDASRLGGRDTVRGFSGDYYLNGEHSLLARNQLGVPLPFTLPSAEWSQIFAGMDAGWVAGPSSEGRTRRLVGSVLGVSVKWPSMQFDASLAAPLYRPREFLHQGMQLYLSAAYIF